MRNHSFHFYSRSKQMTVTDDGDNGLQVRKWQFSQLRCENIFFCFVLLGRLHLTTLKFVYLFHFVQKNKAKSQTFLLFLGHFSLRNCQLLKAN